MTESRDLKKYVELVAKLEAELDKAIVGQRQLKHFALIALISDAHMLLEGNPGLAKTRLVRSLADALGVKFQRIQCTPDLTPQSIIGTRVFDQKTGDFEVETGPIVTNLLLVDEINRTSPKTQSALLEAMQERQFTIGKETYRIERPFMVFATQNPIEHEGTYPLPEAQLDRFMMKVKVGYPGKEEEIEIIDQQVIKGEEKIEKVMNAQDLVHLRGLILDSPGTIFVSPEIKEFIVHIVRETRNFPDVTVGASPRASIYLAEASRSLAFLERREFVLPEDVVAVAPHVLRHRLILSRMMRTGDVEEVISAILKKVRGL